MSDLILVILMAIATGCLGFLFGSSYQLDHAKNYVLENCETQQYIEINNRKINCEITGEWIDE